MGNDQSQTLGDIFRKQDWHLLEGNPYKRLWANRHDPSLTIEQYEIFPENQQKFNYEKEIYYLRKNSHYLVSSLYLQNQEQADLCSTSYRQRLFIQAIPLRLSDIEHIPFPDYLHLYNQTFRGFQLLAQRIGCFSVEEQLIGINARAIVKVWMNEHFERSFAFGSSNITETAMVRNIVELIDKNLLQTQQPANVPTFISYLYRNCELLTFQQAIRELQNFAVQYNQGKIPEKLKCIERVGGVPAIVNKTKTTPKSNTSIVDKTGSSAQSNDSARPQLINSNLMKNSLFYSPLTNVERSVHSTNSNSLQNNPNRGPVMMCTSTMFVERKQENLKNREPIPDLHNKNTIIQLLNEPNTLNKQPHHPSYHSDKNLHVQQQIIVQSIPNLRLTNMDNTQNFQRQFSATDRVFNPPWNSPKKVQNKGNQMPSPQFSIQQNYQKNQSVRFVSAAATQHLVPQFNFPINREVPIVPETFSNSYNNIKPHNPPKASTQQKKTITPQFYPTQNISPSLSSKKNQISTKLIFENPDPKFVKSQERAATYNYNIPNTTPSYNIPSYSKIQYKLQDYTSFNPILKYDSKGQQTTSSSYNYVPAEINQSSDSIIRQLKAIDSPVTLLNPQSFKNAFERRQIDSTPNQKFNLESYVPGPQTTYAEPFPYKTLSYNYQTVFDSNMPNKVNYSLQDDQQFGRNVESMVAPQIQLGSHVSSRSRKSNTPLKFQRNLQMKYSMVQQDGLQQKFSNFSHAFDASRGRYR